MTPRSKVFMSDVAMGASSDFDNSGRGTIPNKLACHLFHDLGHDNETDHRVWRGVPILAPHFQGLR
jgi:hypothetical protein